EDALLAHDGDEQQRVHAELGGLGFHDAAIRPREDGAQHPGIVRRLERRLPTETDGGWAEAARREASAPGEKAFHIRLRRAPEEGAHFRLRPRIAPRHEE